MTTARATIHHGSTGLWSAIVEWPFGYRFVSAIDLQGLASRIDSTAQAIGRHVEIIRRQS